jgi:hypothetical protein
MIGIVNKDSLLAVKKKGYPYYQSQEIEMIKGKILSVPIIKSALIKVKQ